MGNGNSASGDGWLYRGRGLFHLTGKRNYLDFAAHCGVAVDKNPDLLLEPSYAVWSACWYWQHNKLAALADVGDINGLIKKVNPFVDPSRRFASTERARTVLRNFALEMGVL